VPFFECKHCGTAFEVADSALSRYPGWTPRFCREHAPKRPSSGAARGAGRRGGGAARSGAAGFGGSAQGGGSPRELLLTPAQVLERFPDPGQDGVFTDGSCSPNPGPGGWGVVWIENGQVIAERQGHELDTTNNRMELRALIEGYRLLPPGTAATMHSDSNLCVQTVNTWAKGWAARGWRRKTGEIANLDLVRELWDLACAHPEVKLRWIAAHNGHRWNEYADALATAWMPR
jgi:ribonuclease HI